MAIYPKAIWDQQLERLSRIDPMDKLGARYERYLMSVSFSGNSMDAQGRVLIPQKLRAKIGLTRDIVFVGVNRYIEIWDAAVYAKMEAEARGLFEVLNKQASGYEKMVNAAGGDPTKAYMLLLLEKLPELVKTQVEAVKGINIDHVTVWDNGANGTDGKGSTAGFVSGLMKSVPPLNELFEQAGLSLPEYLAKKSCGEKDGNNGNA